MVHPGEPPLVRARPEPLPVEEDLRGRGKDDQGTLRRARCGTERWDRWVGGRPSREGTLRRSSRAAADTSAKARDVQRATWRRGHAASALGSRARATSGGSVARPRCARMAATLAASVSARSARRPPLAGQDVDQMDTPQERGPIDAGAARRDDPGAEARARPSRRGLGRGLALLHALLPALPPRARASQPPRAAAPSRCGERGPVRATATLARARQRNAPADTAEAVPALRASRGALVIRALARANGIGVRTRCVAPPRRALRRR